MAEIVWPVIGIAHGAIDPHGNIELGAFGIERIIAAVARRDLAAQGADIEPMNALLAYQPFEFAHRTHAVVRAEDTQRHEAVREGTHRFRHGGIWRIQQHRPRDAEPVQAGDEIRQAHALNIGRAG